MVPRASLLSPLFAAIAAAAAMARCAASGRCDGTLGCAGLASCGTAAGVPPANGAVGCERGVPTPPGDAARINGAPGDACTGAPAPARCGDASRVRAAAPDGRPAAGMLETFRTDGPGPTVPAPRLAARAPAATPLPAPADASGGRLEDPGATGVPCCVRDPPSIGVPAPGLPSPPDSPSAVGNIGPREGEGLRKLGGGPEKGVAVALLGAEDESCAGRNERKHFGGGECARATRRPPGTVHHIRTAAAGERRPGGGVAAGVLVVAAEPPAVMYQGIMRSVACHMRQSGRGTKGDSVQDCRFAGVHVPYRR